MQNPRAQVFIRICLLYWFVAALWVWLSDQALLAFIADDKTIHRLQIYKDTIFVTLTAGWLYIILRQQAAREREQTEAKMIPLTALVESSNDALISKTLDGTITSWNQAATEIFGYTPEEIVGQNITTLFPPERSQEEEEMLGRLQRGERITNYETVLRKKDGTVLPVSLSISPIKNSQNSLIGIAWHIILNNATEGKAQELKLAEQERLLLAINDAAPNMIFVWDVNVGRITYANQAVEATLGYSIEEVLSKTHAEVSRLLHPEDYPQRHTFHERLRRAGAGVVQSQEYRFLHKNGEWRQLHARDMIFECDAEGHPTYILSVVDDITDRKQTLAALAQYTEYLKRSNNDLEQFAYVASHDLQEPLRAVAGCVQILQRRYQGQLDAQADELIRHTIDGTARMQKLIEDLLDYSLLSTQGTQWQPTSCEAVLAEAGLNLQVAIRESQAQITHDPLPMVRADMAQLILLFQNLLSNAIKFRSLAPLQIHIGAQRRDHQWLFSVRDNGIGLKPQYAERIFRIFQRLHTRSEYPGTGIGLAICQKIVEQHGGRIWVESNLEAGATFCFTLPVEDVPRSTMNGHAKK